MTKTIQAFAILILAIFSFFAGVTYSDSVKNHAGWLFEQKEEEVELPDLSEEVIQENEGMIQEDQQIMNAEQPSEEVDPSTAPTPETTNQAQ
jgi:hypothetical protein